MGEGDVLCCTALVIIIWAIYLEETATNNCPRNNFIGVGSYGFTARFLLLIKN